jgi:thiol-disulfide isomerase/thioredoxin
MNRKTFLRVCALALALLIVSALVILPGCSGGNEPQSQAPDTASEGAAPDFTVYDANGNEVKLSDFRGRPVIVNFWASWCPPCKAELPYFEAAYQQYGDKIVFLMVDLADGNSETQESGARYVAEIGYTFPVYFDLSGSAINAYELHSIPQTVAVDAEGNINFSQIGSLPEETVMRIASELTD